MTRRNLFLTLIVLIIIAGDRYKLQLNQMPQVTPTIINAGFESNPLEGWEMAGILRTRPLETIGRIKRYLITITVLCQQ
jgi:hypothetical protein